MPLLSWLWKQFTRLTDTADYIQWAVYGGGLLVTVLLKVVTGLPLPWLIVAGCGVFAAVAIYIAEHGTDQGWRESPIVLDLTPTVSGPPPYPPEKWLTISGFAAGLGPAGLVFGTADEHYTSLSVGVKIVNRHPEHRVSLNFKLRDPRNGKELTAAVKSQAEAYGLLNIPGWRHLYPPVSVGPQTEISGHFWFFGKSPKDMPIHTIVVDESILGDKFEVPLPDGLVKAAGEIGVYRLPKS